MFFEFAGKKFLEYQVVKKLYHQLAHERILVNWDQNHNVFCLFQITFALVDICPYLDINWFWNALSEDCLELMNFVGNDLWSFILLFDYKLVKW